MSAPTSKATSSSLPDQADRDVVGGRNGTDTTVFVDAGAGTGKTTALVERIVTLVCAGVPVTRIAAITFTEAAAAELRHRVRTALERRAEALREASDHGPAARHVAIARDELDRARFSTLHAFAHRILSDHPLEAGLAPDFELLGEIDEAAAFDLAWEAWLSSFVNEEAIQPALAQMDLVGLTIPRVRALAEALHRDLHRIPADLPRRPVRYDPPAVDLADALTCVADLEGLVDHGRASSPGDALLPLLEEWTRRGRVLADEATHAAGRGEVFAALQDVIDAPSLGNRGTKAAWGELGGGKDVRDRAKLLPAACRDVLAAQADHLLRVLAGWAAHFVTSWAARRRRNATLVFQDLLVLARNLLRDHADVRTRVAGGLDHLLVDEFQDTDPVQIEIAVLLAARDPDAVAASADASGAVDWAGAQLIPGRLFFVGDPKQSIYRFRGADIAVYEGAKDVVVGDGGDLRHLSHNFRSVAGVVDWVNAVFGDLFEPQRHAQPAYRPLTTHRTAPGGATTAATADVAPGTTPSVRWFGDVSEDRAQDTRRLEASDVVDVVETVVGRELVHDADLDRARPARYSDIAVLVRRHATARQLERSFDDAGLPLVVEARSLVFGTDEVRDMVSLLTAIEDPNDGVAVVAALRHAALGCSDADLLAWQAAGGGWWVPDDPDDDLLAHLHEGREGGRDDDQDDPIPVDHPVVRGLRTLADLRAGRAALTVGGMVEHVIDRLHLSELVLAQRRPRDRWRRLGFVVDQAHAYHAGGGHLRGFVRWMRQQEDGGVRAHEHVVADPDDDAVRVTTVHAAKGLEYPIVIVLGLDTGTDRAPHDPRLLWAPDGEPELNLGSDLKTAGFSRLLRGDDDVVGARRHHEHEEARLLYVATTRARDLLVLSLHHSSRRCHAAWLHQRRDLLGDRWARQDTTTGPVPASRDDLAGPPVSADEVRAFRQRHDEITGDAARPRVLAATTIAELLADDETRADDTAQRLASKPSEPQRQLTLEPDARRPRADAAPDAGTGAPGPTDAAQERDTSGSEEDSETWRRGRAGSAVGRAVHAVLQSVDLRTLDDLTSLARSQCAIEGLPLDDAQLVAERVRRAAGTPIVAAALDGLAAGGRIWRELHVGAPLGASPHATSSSVQAVEGFVDMLVELPPAAGASGTGDLVVVDWKTDATAGRDPAEVVARYRPQAATYALALEATLRRPVDRCVFVLTGVDDPARRQVELAGDDLAAAVDDLRRRLAIT